jgi:hypothetical protein
MFISVGASHSATVRLYRSSGLFPDMRRKTTPHGPLYGLIVNPQVSALDWHPC